MYIVFIVNRNKPTKEDLANAIHKKVPDIIAPNLKLLFVGINPGLYTAAIGRHFGHPANRFWKALFDSGLSPKLLSPYENEKLLKLGFGITNLVERPTLRANEVTKEELVEGRKILEKKVKKFKPKFIAILGLGAYQIAFNKKAKIGPQEENIAGAKVWVLPNPSGLNASFTPNKLASIFRQLKLALDKSYLG